MSKSNQHSDKSAKPKIMAVASWGGHLVQLRRLMNPLEGKYDIVYVSTDKEALTDKDRIYVLDDFSRTNWGAIFGSIKQCRKIIKEEKPQVVISTGAAPGLSAIIVGRMMGKRTLWIDSIANVEKLSMCGRLASYIANTTLTQWPKLATKRVKYAGTILS